jgi:hypothetical protein
MATETDGIKHVIDTARSGQTPHPVTLKRGTPDQIEAYVVTGPTGPTIVHGRDLLDRERDFPVRIEKTTILTVLASFIAFSKRFLSDTTAIFTTVEQQTSGQITAAQMTAIFDYDEGHLPDSADDATGPHGAEPVVARNRRHRAVYPFPVSEAWTFWSQIHARTMSQAQLAEMIENRLLDILEPSAFSPELKAGLNQIGVRAASRADLMVLAKGLKVRSETEVQNQVNRDTGEQELVYKETLRDGSGTTTGVLSVPNGFVICIPAFNEGVAYIVTCRLRFARDGATFKWSVTPQRMEVAFRDAIKEAVDVVRAALDVPHFYGKPTDPEPK